MDAPPHVEDAEPLPRSFWVAIGFLAPASILRLLTVQASMRCLGSGEVALLLFPYCLLLLLGFLFKTTPPASAVVAWGTVIITALPLTSGSSMVAGGWSNPSVYCGEVGLIPSLFAGLQVMAAILVGLLSVAVWFIHLSGSRPGSGTITGL